jgi:hypothetical protein
VVQVPKAKLATDHTATKSHKLVVKLINSHKDIQPLRYTADAMYQACISYCLVLSGHTCRSYVMNGSFTPCIFKKAAGGPLLHLPLLT